MVRAVKISHNDLCGIAKRLWKNIRIANFWILFSKEGNYIFFETLATNYRNTKKTQVNMPYFGYLLNFLNANFASFELLEF